MTLATTFATSKATPEQLLREYVRRHNVGVRRQNFESLVAMFSLNAHLEFHGLRIGPFDGRAQIAQAFRAMRPEGSLVLDTIVHEGAFASADYRWKGEPHGVVGTFLLEAHRGRISQLDVRRASLEIMQVDAFTRTPFRGNPAGVVVDARGMSDAQMQDIAREMNLSETAFIFPGRGRQVVERLRWFTPTTEVEFCGHATVAAMHALWDSERISAPTSIQVKARIGHLSIDLEPSGRGVRVMIDVPLSPFEQPERSIADAFLAALHLTQTDLDPNLPIERYRAKLFIPLRSIDALGGLKPAMDRLASLGRELRLSACPFTLQTLEPTSAVHLRFFAPAVGIDEDPVTGAANAPMGAYLARHGVLARLDQTRVEVSRKRPLAAGDGPRQDSRGSSRINDSRGRGSAGGSGSGGTVFSYTGEQGDFVGRPGRVRVEVTTDRRRRVQGVRIGGEAVTVLRGALHMG